MPPLSYSPYNGPAPARRFTPIKRQAASKVIYVRSAPAKRSIAAPYRNRMAARKRYWAIRAAKSKKDNNNLLIIAALAGLFVWFKYFRNNTNTPS